MIKDKLGEFTAKQSSTGGTGAVGSTIDLQSTGIATNVTAGPASGQRDAGSGHPIYVIGTVDTTYLGTSAAITFNLVTSDLPDLSTDNVTLLSWTPPLANLVAGAVAFQTALPIEGTAYKQYLGITQTVTSTLSSGAFTSGLTLDQHVTKTYPQAPVAFSSTGTP